MHESVRNAILPWLAQFEGEAPWMYLDIKGRVATGIGTDINSPNAARQIVWLWPDGRTASADEVTREWCAVHAMQAHRSAGGGSSVWSERPHLHVDPDSLAAYTARIFEHYESQLRLPERIGDVWDTLPAVCQLARLRTSYADGEDAILDGWPRLDFALRQGDWTKSANESQPKDMNVQNASYRASYRAVHSLYLMSYSYAGDALPDTLPDGSSITSEPSPSPEPEP